MSKRMNDHAASPVGSKKEKTEQSLQLMKNVLSSMKELSKDEILESVEEAWKATNSENEHASMKQALAQAVENAILEKQERLMKTWHRANLDETKILDYNWKGEGGTMNIKDAVKEKREDINLLGQDIFCSFSLESFVEICKENDGIELEEWGEECWGCEECGAPGSNLTMWLEQKGLEEVQYRLATKSDVYCSCMSCYGEPQRVTGGLKYYYPA